MTKEAFKILYDQYFDDIRRYIYYRSGDQELATDIAQEAFITVWEKKFDYHPNKTKSLLYKIASDKFLSHYRKGKVEEKKKKVEEGEGLNQEEKRRKRGE